MRLASVLHQGAAHVARLSEDGASAALLEPPDLFALLRSSDWREAAEAPAREVPSVDVVFAPLTRPPKVICVGLNYQGHVEETGRSLPEYPTLFTKFADTLCGAHDDITLPAASPCVDWEVELTIVMGASAEGVDDAGALDLVAGYTVANDVSMRDWQYRTLQWLQGKAFDATTPVGPVMVTPDEIDHARDLRVSCTVGGELMQDSRTSDLIFPPETLVAYVSSFTRLGPGDLILTGTPAGVGHARTPPRFIAAGEEVVVAIEGIGECRNRFVAPAT